MEKFKDGFYKYGMEDNPDDYDEYEEEVIERDEEYDPEDDEEYYDDENGEYDDEEYDDEGEYEDEDYGDEEYYDDDNYDDNYYDDRFNQVLDEIADLKRSVGAAPAVVQQPVAAQVPPYVITSNQPYVNNDVGMYNEISRLRDELSRTQNEQSLHLELNRLKEQMEKEQKQNEAALQNEIKRLHEKLDEMEGGTKKQAPAAPSQSVALEGASEIRGDIQKLVSVNESVLKISKETDGKLQSQISEIRKRLADMPDFSAINRSIESLKNKISQSANDDLVREISELKKLVKNGGNDELESKIDSLKFVAASPVADNSEILRQVYEIKSLVGSPSQNATRHNAIVLELYNEFNKFKFDVESSSYTLGDKLVMLEKFAKKLSQSSEPEANDIYHALVDIADGLLSVKVDSRAVDALNQLADQTKSVSVSPKTADAVAKYANLCDKFQRVDVADAEDIVSDIIDTVNVLQDGKNRDKLDTIRKDADAYFAKLKTSADESVKDALLKKIQPILSLTARDITSYRPAKPPRMYKSSKLVEENEALFDKIEEIKNTLLGLNFRDVGGDSASVSAAPMDITPILNDLKTIKNQLSASDISDELMGRLADLKADYNEIIEKLNGLSAQSETVEEEPVAEISEQDSAMLDDLDYIKAKLEEQDAFISQIADLRADVLSIPIPADINEANNKLCDDIVAQLDKLYEDLAAVSVESISQLTSSVNDFESETKTKLDEIATAINEKSADSESKIDGIAVSVTDILNGYDKMSADIADIKEHVYLKELAPDAEALAASEEEKSTLLKEIADIRERLATTEEIAKEQSETLESQTNRVLSEIENLKTVSQNTEPAEKEPVTLDDATVLTLSDITDKLNEVLYGTADTSVDNIQTLLADIAEVKEKLLGNTAFEEDITKIMDDLSFIRSQIELEESNEDNLSENFASEEISMILEDLSSIKESLASDDEFDTAAEIVSLREDVKAARILDQDDVIKELDGLRTELASIRDELKQITDIRSDLNVYHDEVITSKDSETQTETSPTNEEVNMILGEIVSLRDEIQAFKDEMSSNGSENAEANADSESDGKYAVEDGINAVYEEILNLRTDLQTQNDEAVSAQDEELKSIRESVDELTNVVSRRTTVVESDDSSSAAKSDELNIVLDEIINLKDAIAEVKNDLEQVKAEQNASLDVEVQSIKDMLMQLLADKEEEKAVISTPRDAEETGVADTGSVSAMYDEIVAMREQIAQLSEANELASHGNDEVLEEIALLKEEIAALSSREPARVESDGTDVVDNGENFNILFNEISSLREDIAARNEAPTESEYTEDRNDGINAVLDEIAALKEQIAQMPLATSETVSDTEGVADSANILFDEITALREQVLNIAEANDNDAQTVNALLDEMSQIKEQLAATAPVTVEDNSDAVLSEIAALREELDSIKELSGREVSFDGSAIIDEVNSLRNDFEDVRGDIRALNEEPDLSVINEILALRDEFQAFKDELSETNAKKDKPEEENKANEELMEQVQSLRDQLFAISMANINDGTGGEGTFESYNNIILDEIASLHDEVNSLKAPQTLADVVDEITQIKESLAQDKTSDLRDQLVSLRKDIEALKDIETTDATNDAVLTELSNLKTELENQREADATTLNFMSEMAHLLERQNQYINQVAATKLSSEMETLKNEIAASLSAMPTLESGNSQIMNEIAALKEEISQNSGEPVVIDNSEIIEELAKLKDEISREKDSEENRLILDEISRIKDEISAIAEKEQKADDSGDNLSKSIHDLKTELNQIADIVSVEEEKEEKKPAAPAKKPVQPAKKPAQKKSSGTAKKQGAKSGTKKPTSTKKSASAKTGATVKKKPISSGGQARKKTVSAVEKALDNSDDEHAVPEQTVDLSGDALLDKINAESEIFAPVTTTADSGIALSLSDKATKADDMDIADRLAHQVANKLIMEQLVQQLGDGGVPSDKVDEIVKDILPQEFTTVAIDAQTDKVRRLANSLVLDKLRARLKGKK